MLACICLLSSSVLVNPEGERGGGQLRVSRSGGPDFYLATTPATPVRDTGCSFRNTLSVSRRAFKVSAVTAVRKSVFFVCLFFFSFLHTRLNSQGEFLFFRLPGNNMFVLTSAFEEDVSSNPRSVVVKKSTLSLLSLTL